MKLWFATFAGNDRPVVDQRIEKVICVVIVDVRDARSDAIGQSKERLRHFVGVPRFAAQRIRIVGFRSSARSAT